MKNKKRDKAKPTWGNPVGMEIRRKDAYPLVITSKGSDGRYWCRQSLPNISGRFFQENFSPKEVFKGAVLRTSHYGAPIELVEFHRSGRYGYWEVRFLNDYVQYSRGQLEEMQGESAADRVARDVVTRHERGGISLRDRPLKEVLYH